MGTRKEPIFISSLGRTQGAKLTREGNASYDSLASHPLLSPPPSIPTSSTTDARLNVTPSPISATDSSNGGSSSPRYVPYTPRHRVSTSQVTAQSSPPSLGGITGGGATPQLQLQNLKAAAQNAQLTAGSVGWAICEKLFQEGEGSEWEDIWTAVVTNKASRATMLLPLDQASPQEVITPDYVRDHVVYCAPPSSKVLPVVTLSGLRGTLTDNALTLRSTLSITSPQFQALVSPTSRVSALAALPPLPSPIIVPLKPEYPIFNIPAPHTELPFPSQPQHKPQVRPALATPRLNPFASLFGARASPVPTPTALPPAAVTTEDHESTGHSTDVSVYVIQGRIIKKDVLKGITASLKAELKEALTGLPPWLVERTMGFTAPLHPVIPSDSKKPLARQASSSAKVLLEPDMTDQNTASDSFQNFYFSLEEELRVKEQAMDGSEKKAEVHDTAAAEERRFQTVERVERAICALFYDQLFRQKNSDDASHDEALASRVAALNMLDLGLEHLGIDVGKAGNGVQAIVTEVGKVLQMLQDPSCRSPVDKAATIVAAHNTAVEGLSRLPPIRLKPEDEVGNDPTPLAAQFKQNRSPQDVESLELPEATLEPLPEGSSTDASPNPGSDAVLPLQSPQVPSIVSPDGPFKPTPVASDVLLPFMIYSVVKANPPELVSHLLYIQRYRMRAGGGGEEGFCLINLLAVVEFLENVDLEALGLAHSSRVLSVADLTPLPLSPVPFGEDSLTSPVSAAARLRGRVNQQVEELADSAGKVVFGVVDSSFSALRGLLSTPGTEDGAAATTSPQLAEQTPWNYQRPGFGLLRRGTEFTLASVTSSLPALHRVTTGGSRRIVNAEESGQMLLEVPSRPESIKVGYEHGDDSEEEESSDEDEDGQSEGHSDEEGHDHGKGVEASATRSDVRSVRSFQSMMSTESRDRRPPLAGPGRSERMSLSDRLASVSVRNRLNKDANSLHAQSPPSKRASLLGVSGASGMPIPSSPPSSLAMSLKIPAPPDKFLECQAGDLRISEVAELLQEYRRVVDGMRALNGFEE